MKALSPSPYSTSRSFFPLFFSPSLAITFTHSSFKTFYYSLFPSSLLSSFPSFILPSSSFPSSSYHSYLTDCTFNEAHLLINLSTQMKILVGSAALASVVFADSKSCPAHSVLPPLIHEIGLSTIQFCIFRHTNPKFPFHVHSSSHF